MKAEREASLLEQFEIACIRPKRYPELIRLKNSKKIVYMILFIAFLTFIERGVPFLAWNYGVGGMKNYVLHEIPAFTLSGKGLEMKDKAELVFAGNTSLEIDTSKEKVTYDDLKQDYPIEILISHGNALVKSLDMYQEFVFSDLGNRVITNETLLALIPVLKIFIVLFFIMLYFSNLLQYVFFAICYAVLCRSMVRDDNGRMVSMADAFWCSLFAKCLFAIISSVNISLNGMMDGVIVTILSVFITMGYIRIAEGALLNLPDNQK